MLQHLMKGHLMDPKGLLFIALNFILIVTQVFFTSVVIPVFLISHVLLFLTEKLLQKSLVTIYCLNVVI